MQKALAGAVKGASYNICDETYHKVLVNADDNEGRGSKKGYLWDMIAPSLGLAYFFYDEGSRSEDVILNELDGHEGAERGALFYSLSCSCRLCGVDFFEYLTDVITRVAAMGPKATADTCRDLLPDKWEKKQ